MHPLPRFLATQDAFLLYQSWLHDCLLTPRLPADSMTACSLARFGFEVRTLVSHRHYTKSTRAEPLQLCLLGHRFYSLCTKSYRTQKYGQPVFWSSPMDLLNEKREIHAGQNSSPFLWDPTWWRPANGIIFMTCWTRSHTRPGGKASKTNQLSNQQLYLHSSEEIF